MATFNLNTLKIEVNDMKQQIGRYPELLMIKDECHIILGFDTKFHYKWNAKLGELEKMFEFNVKDLVQLHRDDYEPHGWFGHGLVHIPSQNRILLFGGPYYGLGGSDGIWEFRFVIQIFLVDCQ